jgi:hypothetical protein
LLVHTRLGFLVDEVEKLMAVDDRAFSAEVAANRTKPTNVKMIARVYDVTEQSILTRPLVKPLRRFAKNGDSASGDFCCAEHPGHTTLWMWGHTKEGNEIGFIVKANREALSRDVECIQ